MYVEMGSMEATYKFGSLNGTEERPYEYVNIFALENTSEPERLVIAPSGEHVSLLCDLMRVMPEPFGILYVLTVPRGQGKAGRFQIGSPASRVEAEKFLNTFKDFFENDARHHIWIASTEESDLLVYDKHNVVSHTISLPNFSESRGIAVSPKKKAFVFHHRTRKSATESSTKTNKGCSVTGIGNGSPCRRATTEPIFRYKNSPHKSVTSASALLAIGVA